MISLSIAARIWLATLLAAGLLFALLALTGSTSVAAADGPSAVASKHAGKQCSTKPRAGTVKIRHGKKLYYCRRH